MMETKREFRDKVHRILSNHNGSMPFTQLLGILKNEGYRDYDARWAIKNIDVTVNYLSNIVTKSVNLKGVVSINHRDEVKC